VKGGEKGGGREVDGGGVKRTVHIVLAGRRYRVVTTGTDEELAHLAGVVERRAQAVSGGQGVTPDAILLAAMTFVYESEEATARAERVMELASEGARDLLARVDEALGEIDSGNGDDDSGEDDAT
jgi:cell division protein ZapA (FtsZ GTPase activity inhibitor)